MNFLRIILLYLLTSYVFAGTLPNNEYKIGNSASTDQKGFVFDTGDGAGNVNLKVNDSKSLIFSGNILQMGDGASSNSKDFIIDPTSSTSLRWNGSDNFVELKSDKFRFGKGVDSDIKFEFDEGVNSPYFGYDSTKKKLTFSNDGVIEKALGSGSGSGSGGVNLAQNESFEDGLTNWTSSGGTFTQESYTDAIESDLKYARFVSTVAGEYVETDCYTKPNNLSGGGMADIKYLDGENFDLKVIDCTDVNPLNHVEISTGTLGLYSEWNKAPTQTFSLPTKMKLRIISTDAGTIDFDNAYLGGNKGTSSGTPVIEGFLAKGLAGFGSANTAIPYYSTIEKNTIRSTGTLSNDSTLGLSFTCGKPQCLVTLSGMSDFGGTGEYMGATLDSTQLTTYIQALSDGSMLTMDQQAGSGLLGPGFSYGVLMGYGQVIRPHAGNIYSTVGSLPKWTISITVQSSSDAEAFTPEQANFAIDAVIGGETSGTTLNVSGTYLEQQHPTLKMSLSKGSAKIACNGSIVPDGLTCSSGSEVLGLKFKAPVSGQYEVCTTLSIRVANANSYINIAHVQNDTNTIISLGSEYNGYTSAGSVIIGNTGRFCHKFNMQVGDNTIKIFGRNTGSTAYIPLEHIADNGVSDTTQGFVRFNIKLVQNNVSKPFILNMVDTSSPNGSYVDGCTIEANGTYSNCPDIDYVTFLSTGNYKVFTKKSFSPNPSCTVNTLDSWVNFATITDRGANFLQVATGHWNGTQTFQNSPFNFVCVNKR